MMKKLIVAIAAVAMMMLGAQAFAQSKYGADSAECIKYLSYYNEYFKQKGYEEALPNWREAYRLCPPQANQNLLINGTTLMRRLITQNARNQEYRKALIDTLMTLHDLRAEYYPSYKATALNNKGVDLSNFVKDDNERLYRDYEAIIAALGEKTKASIFLFDLNAAVALYQEGKLDAEKVIALYQRNIELVDKTAAATEAEVEQKKNIRTDIESIFITSKVASCENLLELFTPRFNAAPEDLQLATNIVKMMGMTEGCTDNDLFLKAATTMYRLDPSYTSAYGLFKLNSARGNTADAIKYMTEAIESPNSDAQTDAQYSYELAAFCYKSGQSARAYEYARAAVEGDASLAGKAYFLMGTIWSSTNCGGDEISRRAPYWVAVDYFNRAKNADESLTEEANRMISQCARYYPQTAEAFMYDLSDGQSYTVTCGALRATTTVRTQK